MSNPWGIDGEKALELVRRGVDVPCWLAHRGYAMDIIGEETDFWGDRCLVLRSGELVSIEAFQLPLGWVPPS